MSDDLVRRLKAIEVQPIDQFGRWLTNIHAEAAAEIERLRELFRIDGEQHAKAIKEARQDQQTRLDAYKTRVATLEAELAAFRAFLTERGCGGVGDANGMHDLAQHHEELIADNERQAAALQRIAQWADAYPPSAFPPMTDDWAKRANAVLVDHGMTIDRISADAMRHVIEGVGKIAAAALADAPGEKP